MNGDTRLFGGMDFLQKGDKITYGVSFVSSSARTDGGDASVEKKLDLREIGAGVGYNVGGMTMELDFLNASTTDDTFADSKGVAAQKKSANTMYMTGIYDF